MEDAADGGRTEDGRRSARLQKRTEQIMLEELSSYREEYSNMNEESLEDTDCIKLKVMI